MILIVTNASDYTADFLILSLKRRSLDFLRFNTEDFPEKVKLSIEFADHGFVGTLCSSIRTVELDKITGVWYRRPEPSHISDEIIDQGARDFAQRECAAMLDGLWSILPAVWISRPNSLNVAESKMLQLAEAQRLGFLIPQTLISNSPQTALTFCGDYNDMVIYKPLRNGIVRQGESNALIYTNVLDRQHIKKLENVQYAPVLLQSYIHKRTELRVTVVGSKVYTVEIRSQEKPEAQHDWRRVDATQLRHFPYELPTSVSEKCIALTQKFGLLFGAIDLILTPEGEYVFLEINPNGQWAWVEQMCPELHISDAIIDLLVSHESDHSNEGYRLGG